MSCREVLEYELGSQEKLVVAVDVHNAGEEAFQSKVQVRVPRGVLYNRFLLVQNTAPDDVTPLCSPLVKAEVEEVSDSVLFQVLKVFHIHLVHLT